MLDQPLSKTVKRQQRRGGKKREKKKKKNTEEAEVAEPPRLRPILKKPATATAATAATAGKRVRFRPSLVPRSQTEQRERHQEPEEPPRKCQRSGMTRRVSE